MSRDETASLAPLRRMDGEAAFDEPWQAQVLAMADALIGEGVITPGDWSGALGRELEAARLREEPDRVASYYSAALRALEGLLESHAGISAAEASARREAWMRAYRSTPHGQPVELEPS